MRISLRPSGESAVSHDVLQGLRGIVRWYHPVLGSVSPAVTIELAQRSGLIVPLSAWILERACSQADLWAPPSKCRTACPPPSYLQGQTARRPEPSLPQYVEGFPS